VACFSIFDFSGFFRVSGFQGNRGRGGILVSRGGRDVGVGRGGALTSLRRKNVFRAVNIPVWKGA